MDLASKLFKGDRVIWVIFMFLCLVSVIEVFSATSTIAYKNANHWAPIVRHATFLLGGFVLVLLMHNIPCRFYSLLSLLLPVSMVLLAITPFVGVVVNGEPRWLEILGIRFQPSEIAKIAAIGYTAFILSKRNWFTDKQMFWYILGGVGGVCFLIFFNNGSTAILLFAVTFMMMFIGQISIGRLLRLGGAGIIGSGGRTVEWTRDEVRKAKSLTDKPFGVNVMLMAPNIAEIIAMLCEEKVAFVTLGAGNPVPHIPAFHAAGIKVIPVVPNVKLAKRIEAAGADAMVIEGMEAGGHIGKQTTMALMENVLPQIKSVPVLVAGGISDGRALAAALLMGAAGVQMGSRFLLTEECPANPAAKEAIVKATDTDSVATGYSRNLGVRCLANAFTDAYTAREIAGAPKEELMAMGTGTNRKGIVEGDIVNGTVMCGQSLNVLNDILPCKDVMERIIAEAKEAIANVQKIEL